LFSCIAFEVDVVNMRDDQPWSLKIIGASWSWWWRYRAQKIRSKSVAVLIHNSENHPNVQSCSVAVHFQLIEDINDDEFTVVPNSQFSVSRTAFKVLNLRF